MPTAATTGWDPPPAPKPVQPESGADPTKNLWETPRQPQTLLEPEYHGAYHAYKQDPSPANASALLSSLNPVIGEALRSYAGGESGTGTARARAKLMALDAVKRYDPERAKLRTHMLSHLRGLRRTVERSIAPVYVPEQWRLDARKMDMAYPDLRDELGREPSDAELSDRIGVPLARLERARQVPGVLAGSQAEGGLSFDAPPEKAWNQWVAGVYHDLGHVDQVILEHSFGLHGKPTLPANQIAEMLKLSPGAVSQRKSKIQGMLDQYETFMRGRNR